MVGVLTRHPILPSAQNFQRVVGNRYIRSLGLRRINLFSRVVYNEYDVIWRFENDLNVQALLMPLSIYGSVRGRVYYWGWNAHGLQLSKLHACELNCLEVWRGCLAFVPLSRQFGELTQHKAYTVPITEWELTARLKRQYMECARGLSGDDGL